MPGYQVKRNNIEASEENASGSGCGKDKLGIFGAGIAHNGQVCACDHETKCPDPNGKWENDAKCIDLCLWDGGKIETEQVCKYERKKADQQIDQEDDPARGTKSEKDHVLKKLVNIKQKTANYGQCGIPILTKA